MFFKKKDLLHFCLILGLALGAVWARAENPQSGTGKILHRQVVFEKAYELLASVLLVAEDMGIVNNDFIGQEFSTFDKIKAVVLSDFMSGKKDRLQFSEDQELFKLDPNQPPRTAVTSSDPKDPIYINLKVINDAAGAFELEDALQILIHEYGHKTQGKIQTVVDSVAAKIRASIIKHIVHEMSENGHVLTAVALPTMSGWGGLAKLIGSQSRKSLFAMTTAILFQGDDKVSDLSDTWEMFLKSHAGFKSLKPEIRENTELRLWEVAFNKTVTSAGSETEIYSIEFMKSDVASPSGQPGVSTTTTGRDGTEFSNIVRSNAPDLRAELAIDVAGAKMTSIFMRRVLTHQPQLKAKIAHLERTSHDSFQIGIQIDTPFDFRKVKLLLEAEDGEFSVLAKTVWPRHDRVLFDVTLPRAQAEKKFTVRAFVADERALVMLDEGITLQALATSVKEGALRLESLRFADGERSVLQGKIDPLNPGQSKMILILESPQDIQEVRLESRRDRKVLAPSAYTTKDSPEIYKIQDFESVRSDYDIRYLDRSEFTQVRRGNFVEVTVPLNEELRHFDAADFVGDPRAPRTSVVARDDGERAITVLEVIDTSLRNLRVAGEGRTFSYQLVTPLTPASRVQAVSEIQFAKFLSRNLCRRSMTLH